jgi:hypothetical protein
VREGGRKKQEEEKEEEQEKEEDEYIYNHLGFTCIIHDLASL